MNVRRRNALSLSSSSLSLGLLLAHVAGAAPSPPQVPSSPSPPVPANWPERSRALASHLMAELKSELEAAMQAGGPVSAIEVCRTRAPAIAERLSRDSGAEMGRTALRVRNPANAPDEVERQVLQQFATELVASRSTPPAAPPAPPASPPEAMFDTRGTGGAVEHRYMRAIPMQPQCLPCHGATLAPELATTIRANYPEDAATGFEPGDLRGAVVVRWPTRD